VNKIKRFDFTALYLTHHPYSVTNASLRFPPCSLAQFDLISGFIINFKRLLLGMPGGLMPGGAER
jgi:hypothetical protein